jgi:hypothetical protein
VPVALKDMDKTGSVTRKGIFRLVWLTPPAPSRG